MDMIDIIFAKKLAGGGGSGASDYNDLDNKPKVNDVELTGNKTAAQLGLASSDEVAGAVRHDTEQTLTVAQQMQARANQGLYYSEYEATAEPIEWDGNTDGRASFTVSAAGTNMTYYKVSGAVLHKSDVVGGTYYISAGGQSMTQDITDGNVDDSGGLTTFISYVSANAGVYYGGAYDVPEDGTYYGVPAGTVIPDDFAARLEFPAEETVHTIEEKYLPNMTQNHFYVVKYDAYAGTVDHYSYDILAAVSAGMIPILIDKNESYNPGHNSFYTYSGFNDSNCVFSKWSAYSGMVRILIGESTVRSVDYNYVEIDEVNERISEAIGDAIGGEY